ncbi:MAG: serine--tRNA ligase [Candidatus Nealsonbacteria bacterium]
MLDLKFVLKNRSLVEKNCRNRNITVDLDLIEKLAQKRSQVIQVIEQNRAKINKISKQTAIEKSKKETLIREGRRFRELVKEKEAELKKIEIEFKEEFVKVPNLSHPETPIGFGENDNLEVEKVGKIKKFSFPPKNHLELGKTLDIIDFEAGAKVVGNKFYYLKNEAVFLEFALIQYAFEILAKNGFQPFSTPDLAKLSIIEGIGFAPRGPETQIYRIEDSDLGLIATAEIALGGMFRDSKIEIEQLPLKLSGFSHCFRTEAGAYGKASRGLYRVHQFSKVEMFVLTLPENSDEMLKHLVDTEKEIYKGLGIPFRVVSSCTAELGASAYRKFDLEAWLPGENRWGEITSASNCTDYQARRLNIKIKKENQEAANFIHTLNGTAIAISRTLIAILENFQQADGSIEIPQVLQRFTRKKKISLRK